MYASRALLIARIWSRRGPTLTFYFFAAGLGLTWLGTVPPTAAIVGKLFGTRYLATLFGLTLLSHQIGGFLGAWLGGLAIDAPRRLPVDVVRRHGARRAGRARQPADPRSADPAHPASGRPDQVLRGAPRVALKSG